MREYCKCCRTNIYFNGTSIVLAFELSASQQRLKHPVEYRFVRQVGVMVGRRTVAANANQRPSEHAIGWRSARTCSGKTTQHGDNSDNEDNDAIRQISHFSASAAAAEQWIVDLWKIFCSVDDKYVRHCYLFL